VADVEGSAQPRRAHYEVRLVALLSLNFGILFFDRNALNFVMPFVKPDLGLTNTQVGLTASALSFAWALSALFVGAAADRGGRRKFFLIAATIAFSLCSFLTGLATSFLILLASRLLMGFAEGGVAPISQSITALAVSPARRGLAMGVMQNFGSNLLGSFAAPVLLVAFATAYGWHKTFYLAGIPGLISAFLLWRFIDEPATVAALPLETRQSLRSRVSEILAHRNILLCVWIAILLVSYLVICWAFTPLFLTKVRGFTPGQMGWLMGTQTRDRIYVLSWRYSAARCAVLSRLHLDSGRDLLLRLGADRRFPLIHGNDSLRDRQRPTHDNRDGHHHGIRRGRRRCDFSRRRRLGGGPRGSGSAPVDHDGTVRCRGSSGAGTE
jgi:MFS family permease